MATDISPGPSTSGGSLPAGQGHQRSSGSSDAQVSRGGQRSQGSQWPLWFGLFGGVAAWTLHLAIAYPLVYNGCALGLDQLSTWLLILTAVLGAVALLATIAAFFTWRGIRSAGVLACPAHRHRNQSADVGRRFVGACFFAWSFRPRRHARLAPPPGPHGHGPQRPLAADHDFQRHRHRRPWSLLLPVMAGI